MSRVHLADRPYGHSCVVTYRRYGEENLVEKEIHRKGSRGRVELAARLMNGYVSHRDVQAYSLEQWKRVFGCGSETGRYWVE